MKITLTERGVERRKKNLNNLLYTVDDLKENANRFYKNKYLSISHNELSTPPSQSSAIKIEVKSPRIKISDYFKLKYPSLSMIKESSHSSKHGVLMNPAIAFMSFNPLSIRTVRSLSSDCNNNNSNRIMTGKLTTINSKRLIGKASKFEKIAHKHYRLIQTRDKINFKIQELLKHNNKLEPKKQNSNKKLLSKNYNLEQLGSSIRRYKERYKDRIEKFHSRIINEWEKQQRMKRLYISHKKKISRPYSILKQSVQ